MSLAERDRSKINLELLLSMLLSVFHSLLVLYDRANRQLQIRRPGAINENGRDVISSVGLDEGRKCRWVRKNWRAHALNDERELLSPFALHQIIFTSCGVIRELFYFYMNLQPDITSRCVAAQ